MHPTKEDSAVFTSVTDFGDFDDDVGYLNRTVAQFDLPSARPGVVRVIDPTVAESAVVSLSEERDAVVSEMVAVLKASDSLSAAYKLGRSANAEAWDKAHALYVAAEARGADDVRPVYVAGMLPPEFRSDWSSLIGEVRLTALFDDMYAQGWTTKAVRNRLVAVADGVTGPGYYNGVGGTVNALRSLTYANCRRVPKLGKVLLAEMHTLFRRCSFTWGLYPHSLLSTYTPRLSAAVQLTGTAFLVPVARSDDRPF